MAKRKEREREEEFLNGGYNFASFHSPYAPRFGRCGWSHLTLYTFVVV
jgi:hypothetical protein